MKAVIWRLRNFSLFLIGLISLVFSRSRRRPPKTIHRALVLQGARLGDMVCSTPLFAALKKKFPRCALTVAGDAVNQKLLAHHPDVDGYILWQRNFWQAFRAIRSGRYEFGTVCLPSLEGLVLLILGGVRCIVVPRVVGGSSPYETATYRFLSRFVITAPNHNGRYVPREYLRLLEPLGITSDDTTKKLAFAPESERSVEAFFRDEGVALGRDLVVGILPGVGGNPLKRWAPEKFARLAEHLSAKHGAKTIILGSGKDKPDVEQTLSALQPGTKVINAFGRFSIDEMKACIASLSLFISADTGPIYVAEAFGIPTIDIVGPVDENVQPPRGELHQVVVPPRKKAALAVLENIPEDIKEARRQRDATTVEMVVAAADTLIALIRQKRNS